VRVEKVAANGSS